MDRKPKLVAPDDEEMIRRLVAMDRVEQLVAEGRSRVTAHRIVELERATTGVGRARRHRH